MTTKYILRVVQSAGFFLLATHQAGAGACDSFTSARNAAYSPYIRGVLDEVKSIQNTNGGATFDAALGDLGNRYARLATGGDSGAVRKLIGLGLFTAFAAKTEPLETTFKLTCESAKKLLPPKNVADPLACAVIALDGTRRANPANRTLAKDMVDVAKSNLMADPNLAGAQQLFDAVAPTVLSCAL